MRIYAFAGMDCPRVRYPQLNDVVEADLAEQGYQVLTDAGQQVDKVIQLYEVIAHLLHAEVELTASYGNAQVHAYCVPLRRVVLTCVKVQLHDGIVLRAY